MFTRWQGCEPVKPVVHSLEVPGGNMIVEMWIVVTSIPGLLCGEITTLLKGNVSFGRFWGCFDLTL
jgi:hypothetical protein